MQFRVWLVKKAAVYLVGRVSLCKETVFRRNQINLVTFSNNIAIGSIFALTEGILLPKPIPMRDYMQSVRI